MSSVPRNSEIARSSSLCGSCVPQMNRTDAMPLPQRVEGLVRRLHHLGMIGQAQVVVGAHVQDIGPSPDADVRLLGRGEHALALPEAGRADLVELAGQVLLHGAVHCRKAPRLVRYAQPSFQVRMTFPDWPDRMASKPFSKSWKR